MRDALAWYLVVQVAAVAVWPAVFQALEPLGDRGWAAAKAAGLLALAWLAWFVCMLVPLPFTQATLLVVVAAIAAASWTWQWRTNELQTIKAWLRCRRGLVGALEGVFLATFVLFGLLRAHEPAVTNFEKPMDMAFLNGFMSAQRLPTQDTWLSGYGVPYYYFGYFIAATVGKLTGIQPSIAYNLSAATVPALAVVGIGSLAWTVARAAGAPTTWSGAGAALSSMLAMFCGNLSTFFEFLFSRGVVDASAGTLLGIKRFGEGVTPGLWPPAGGLWWFKASRVLPNTQPDGINEFPFFTALLSDLHPHFVAIPFELLVLAISAAHVLSRGETLRRPSTMGLAATALGGLLVINTWDVAPFWLLYIGLSLYAARFTCWRWRWVSAVVTPFAGVVLYAPYFIGYGGPPLGLGRVADQTPFGSLLVLFGWAIVLLGALGLFARWCIGDRRGWMVVGAGIVVGGAVALLGQPGIGLLVALLAVLLPWPGLIDRADPPMAMTIGIAAFATAMLLGVELIFLDDAFHSRMNTVFKFHENAWILCGLVAGIGLALIGRFTLRIRWLVAALGCAFLAMGLVYPLSAIATRLAEVPPGGITLDGLSFLSPDDRAAVRWLADQNSSSAGGRVVIAESLGDEYSSAAFAATYSGAATVLGWAGHELQWRGPIPEIGARQADLDAIYRDAASTAIKPILDRYAIQYVFVGELERKRYGDEVSSRFDGILPVAFRSGANLIYRVR